MLLLCQECVSPEGSLALSKAERWQHFLSGVSFYLVFALGQCSPEPIKCPFTAVLLSGLQSGWEGTLSTPLSSPPWILRPLGKEPNSWAIPPQPIHPSSVEAVGVACSLSTAACSPSHLKHWAQLQPSPVAAVGSSMLQGQGLLAPEQGPSRYMREGAGQQCRGRLCAMGAQGWREGAAGLQRCQGAAQF